jgi:hypothetical protein
VTRFQRLVFAGLAIAVAGTARAQQPVNAPPQGPPPIAEQTRKNAAAPCLEPPPMIRWEEYQGPFRKTVGAFARTLERKSVGEVHYKPGTLLCSLEARDKFFLFVHDSTDPLAFLTAGFYAGLDQAEDVHHHYGQGAEGYGKRFGADLAGQTSVRFFTDFAYPTIFSEDPRYYRLGEGSGEKRLTHALAHTFVAHRDSGKRMFNFAEWLGTASAVLISNTYLPDREARFSPTARRVGFSILEDMGFDILREFWPEIARKLRMPFREKLEPESAPPASVR